MDDQQRRDLAYARFDATMAAHWNWLQLGSRGDDAMADVRAATVTVALGGPEEHLQQVIVRYVCGQQAGQMLADCLRVVRWANADRAGAGAEPQGGAS